MSLRVYLFDAERFFVDMQAFAHPNPEEPDNPLIPADAVTFAPSELAANQCARLNADKTAWEVLPDLRGKKYWFNDVEHIVTERGVDLPVGAVLEKPAAVIATELIAAKAVALQRIEAVADAYQKRFLGANSADRQARFQHNLAAAQRVLADVYSDDQSPLKQADLLAMQVQADAQNAKPETTAPMTALDFARWVVEWQPKSVVISAYIENILVTGRTGLNALTTVEQIEPFLTALATQAEAKFAELVV